MYHVVWCWPSCSFKHGFRRWFLWRKLCCDIVLFQRCWHTLRYLARFKRRKKVFGKWRQWNTFWTRRYIMQQGLVSGKFYVSLWICQTQLKIIHSWYFYLGWFNFKRIWANNDQSMSESSKERFVQKNLKLYGNCAILLKVPKASAVGNTYLTELMHRFEMKPCQWN